MTFDRNRMRYALTNAVQALEPNLFITLVFNRIVPMGSAAASVEEWCKRLERRALGKRWLNYPSDERLKAYAFPEHIDSNLHFHLAGRAGPRIYEVALSEGHAIWRQLTKTGHADVQTVNRMIAVSRYVTKVSRGDSSIENLVPYGPKFKL